MLPRVSIQYCSAAICWVQPCVLRMLADMVLSL